LNFNWTIMINVLATSKMRSQFTYEEFFRKSKFIYIGEIESGSF
jgi:hypothetical protein